MSDARKEKFVKDFVARILKEKAQVVDANSGPVEAADAFAPATAVSWMDRLKKSAKKP
jgi:hypothetical protein